MVSLYIYDKQPANRLEYTPAAQQEVQSEDSGGIPQRWFDQLQAEGLIPQNIDIDDQIAGLEEQITYKEALVNIVSSLNTDQDNDGLYDYELSELVLALQENNIITSNPASQSEVRAQIAEVLLSRKKPDQLKYSPPELTPYCRETVRRSEYTVPSTVLSQTEASEVAIRSRFEDRGLDPYKMAEAIAYFEEYSEEHSNEELMQELESYLDVFYVHLDDTALRGRDASSHLAIGSSSVLTQYFTRNSDQLVVDCNIMAEVAHVVLDGVGITDTKFVAMDYFGEDPGHVVLYARAGNEYWIVNNADVFSVGRGITENGIVQMFSEGRNNLVSFVISAPTYSDARKRPGKVDPLDALLNSPYPAIRENAADYLLSHLPEPSAVSVLVDAITQDNVSSVRCTASKVLQKMVSSNGSIQISAADTVLLRDHLMVENNPETRLLILQVLYETGKMGAKEYVERVGQELSNLSQADHSYSNNILVLKSVKLLAQQGEEGIAMLQAHLTGSNSYFSRFEALKNLYELNRISEQSYIDALVQELDALSTVAYFPGQGDLIRAVVSILVEQGQMGIDSLGRFFDGEREYPLSFQQGIMRHQSIVTNPAAFGLAKMALEADTYNDSIREDPMRILYFAALDGNEQAIDVMLEAMTHSNPDTQRLAVIYLRDLYDAGAIPTTYKEQVVDSLIGFLEAEMGNNRTGHGTYMSHNYVGVIWHGQSMVMHFLVDVGMTQEQEESLASTYDRSLPTLFRSERQASIHALGIWASTGSVLSQEVLLGILQDNEQDIGCRLFAAEELALIPDIDQVIEKRAVDTLIDLLNDDPPPAPFVVNLSTQALEKFGTKKALRFLRRYERAIS